MTSATSSVFQTWGPDQHDRLQLRREPLELLQGGVESDALREPVVRVDRQHARDLGLGQVAIAPLDRVQTPRLALRGGDHPALPIALPVRLVAEELQPRERAGVGGRLRAREDQASDRPVQLVMEFGVQVEFVATKANRLRLARAGSATGRRERELAWPIAVIVTVPVHLSSTGPRSRPLGRASTWSAGERALVATRATSGGQNERRRRFDDAAPKASLTISTS
jgi:hypothetical protein